MAPLPPPPVMVTVGVEPYPEPPLVRVMPPRDVGDIIAVALAPDPPPPEKETVGGEV